MRFSNSMRCWHRSSLWVKKVTGSGSTSDDRYRWVLHRLWIAVGNGAITYVRLAGLNLYTAQPWARLYRLRNMLAHDQGNIMIA